MTETITDLPPKVSKSTATTRLMHGQPHNIQVAALCWRRNRKGKIRVLLITSRETGRWVTPKGWPMHKRSYAQAAEREAFEEAGVKGRISEDSIGIFTYNKLLGRGKSIPCVVHVFPLEVQTLLRQYPENGQRRSRWFSRKNAAGAVRETELRALIRKFDPDNL